MNEATIVRENLMTQPGYEPYCGGDNPSHFTRAKWNGKQFACPHCLWVSSFPDDFLTRYREFRATWEQPA